MASIKIHDFTATSTDPLYINYTDLSTKVDYATSKLTISFKDVTMSQEEGIPVKEYFDYHIKAFLAVKFFDADGNYKSTAGNEYAYKAIFNNDSKVYKYSSLSEIPSVSPTKPRGSGYNYDQRDTWQHFEASYKIIEKLSETEGGGSVAAWDAVSTKRNNSFTISIPPGAASAKLYVMSDSDPYWQYKEYPTYHAWEEWCESCPCGSHATRLDDGVNKLEEVEILVEPISKPAKIISVTDNGNNTVTFTMPPFQNGTNNAVACQEGFINFQRSCVYTGEYFNMGTSDFKHNDKATKLIKNAAGQYEKDLNILSESEIAADGRYYKNSDGTYTYCTDSKNTNATYRAVGYDRLLKRQYFPKTNNAAGSSYERIGNSWNPGKSITLTLPIPFAALWH